MGEWSQEVWEKVMNFFAQVLTYLSVHINILRLAIDNCM